MKMKPDPDDAAGTEGDGLPELPGLTVDDEDRPELSELVGAMRELAQASTSVARSNERMASNFVAYTQSNARRIRFVGVGVVLMLILGGLSLWGLKTVHDSQHTNGSVLTAISNAENPNSKAAKASRAQTVGEIDIAVSCIENHQNRVSEVQHQQTVEARKDGCPVDTLPK